MNRMLAALLAAAAPCVALAQPAPPPSDPAIFLHDPPKPASVKGRFTVVSVGDVMLGRPQAANPDPEFQKVVAMIRAASVAIGNQEGEALDTSVLVHGSTGPGGLIASPAMAADYKAMGFDLMSVANNHSVDWGVDGLLESLRLLDAAGIAHAGGGKSLAEARAAGDYATPQGKVGLVATASTFKPGSIANDPLEDLGPRPGISILRTRTVRLVPPNIFAAVRKLATDLASPLAPAPAPDLRQFTFGEQVYRLSDHVGLHYQMDQYDLAGLLKAVREAKAKDDLVVFHIHAHESPTGVDDDTPAPPDFLVTLFHDAVDAGADMVMGGGPHSLRGVEIYRGKPIFYGLGLFFFKPQLRGAPDNMFTRTEDEGYPADPDPRPHNPEAWYDSVLAESVFDEGRLREVRLYPIDLHDPAAPAARGLPHLAHGARAAEILARLRRDSAPLGTTITIDGEVGVVALP
ncbi:MAG: CapA family protein [Proteobacteria bacterium]|nr:CapA family protein [Pseudomonadota bacterium]